MSSLIDPADPERALDAIIGASSAATDVLLVYYVGHGVLNAAGNLHLATRATIDLTRGKAGFQALSYVEIAEAVLNCQARTVIVVLDCCYSNRAHVPVPSGALLVSADRDEHALAPVGEQYTGFSGELVRALCEGVPTAPAHIRLQHLYDYLSRRMTVRGRPQPILRTGNLASDVALAVNRAYRNEPEPPDAPTEPEWRGTCPYRGLEPYSAQDHLVFRGRGALTAHVLSRLAERTRTGGVTVVAGPSGSGKSSLLAAGVLPAISHGDLGVTGSAAWPHITITPGPDPFRALAAGLARLTGQDAGLLAAHLVRGPRAVREAIADVVAPRSAVNRTDQRVVLVVDQFEELFTHVTSDEVRHDFVAALHAVAGAGEHALALVVLGLRSDFHGQCARFPALVTALESNQIVVGPMSYRELRAAIVEPAQEAGLELEPGLVDILLRDTGAVPSYDRSAEYDPGALPYLSHALLATWQRRRNNLLTVRGYHEVGGVVGAIAGTADRTFSSLDVAAQQAARRLLLAMVRISADTPDTRRRLSYDSMFEVLPHRAPASAALHALADARLITLDQHGAQITHEALIRSWPRLREWLDQDRAERLLHQAVEDAAAAWKNEHRDASLLYRGSRLATARDWAMTRPPTELSVTAREFMAASVRYRRRARRARQSGVAALAVLLVLVTGVSVFALQQRAVADTQRDRAVFNQLLAKADQLLDSDQSLAAQLLVTAYRMSPTPALYTKLVETGARALSRPFTLGGKDVYCVAFSPDGSLLATAGADNTLQMWKVDREGHVAPVGSPVGVTVYAVRALAFRPDGKLLFTGDGNGAMHLWRVGAEGDLTPVDGTFNHGAWVTSAAFSPDGRTLATASSDNTVKLWDVTDPARWKPAGPPLSGHSNFVYSVAFSRDGRHLATGAGDSTVRLWDVSDPSTANSKVLILRGHTAFVTSVAFSPDGRTLASGGGDGKVRLWDASDPGGANGVRPRGAPLAGHNSVTSLSYNSAGNMLASGGDEGTVRLWDLGSADGAALMGTPLKGHKGPLWSVAFRSEANLLATASADGTFRVWDLPNIATHSQPVNSVGFSPDGRTLATGTSPVAGTTAGPSGPGDAATSGPSLWFWQLPGLEEPVPVAGSKTDSHTSIVGGFTSDGRLLITGSPQGVQLWDASVPDRVIPDGQPILSPSGNLYWLGVTNNAMLIGDSDGRVQIWDIGFSREPSAVGGPIQVGQGADAGPVIHSMDLSPDGRTIAVGYDDYSLGIFQIGGSPGEEPHSSYWQVAGATVDALAFSPDGHSLAVSNDNGRVELWDVTNPNSIASISAIATGHSGYVPSLAFSADGLILATGGADKTVRLWNVADRANPTSVGEPLTGHTDAVTHLAFSRDGRYLASGSVDRTVSLWDTDVLGAIARICTDAGEVISAEQQQLYDLEVPSLQAC
nr:caspase family protein [Pseudonocardia halophobica]